MSTKKKHPQKKDPYIPYLNPPTKKMLDRHKDKRRRRISRNRISDTPADTSVHDQFDRMDTLVEARRIKTSSSTNEAINKLLDEVAAKHDTPWARATSQNLRTFSSGASSSVISRFELIPRAALTRLTRRFELGIERHKERAWNALQNPQAVKDREFVLARLGHTIDHAYKLIGELFCNMAPDGDDHAAAIMFGGVVACMATEPKTETKPTTTKR